MLKSFITVSCLVSLSFTGFCQGAARLGSKQDRRAAKDTLYTDIYKGTILDDGKDNPAELRLMHKRYYDMGDFVLLEPARAGAAVKVQETKGGWTVLKGSATDENATVVEIDANLRTLTFLWLKNGNLQQLDTALRELKPVGKYVLRMQKG